MRKKYEKIYLSKKRDSHQVFSYYRLLFLYNFNIFPLDWKKNLLNDRLTYILLLLWSSYFYLFVGVAYANSLNFEIVDIDSSSKWEMIELFSVFVNFTFKSMYRLYLSWIYSDLNCTYICFQLLCFYYYCEMLQVAHLVHYIYQ